MKSEGRHSSQDSLGTKEGHLVSCTRPGVFPRLETKRLVLRQIVSSDAEDIFRIFSDHEAMRYWSCRPHTSVRQAHTLIDDMAGAMHSGTGIHWAITMRGEDQLIGKCGYNELRPVHRRGDISYIIGREQWGKGIVKEALCAVLDYGFDRLNLHSIEAGVTPGNDGSTRLLEKLGFRLEGHLRESFWAEDRFVDSLIYSLLGRDWCNGALRP
jgi:[ribosomal protein S5]-alanine N-acetyltransferase